MKHWARILVLFLLCITGLSAAEISDTLPAPTAVMPWKLSGQPQNAQGEDLYLLINGGAELVLEYGFRQALLAEYFHPDGGRLNIEIYEMEDSESAYGLYSLKKSRSSTLFPVGQEGALDDYYLNVWQGSYLITLIGLDRRAETRTGLKLLAQAVAAKIPLSGKPPRLLEKVASLFVEKPLFTLIKGPLGGSNRSSFPIQPFFAAATGLILQFADSEIMIVEYAATKSKEEIYKNLQTMIVRKQDLSWKIAQDGSMLVQDSSGKLFRIIFQSPFLYFIGGEMGAKKLETIRRALEGSI